MKRKKEHKKYTYRPKQPSFGLVPISTSRGWTRHGGGGGLSLLKPKRKKG
jgi:hypothetical protein